MKRKKDIDPILLDLETAKTIAKSTQRFDLLRKLEKPDETLLATLENLTHPQAQFIIKTVTRYLDRENSKPKQTTLF